VVGSVFRAWVGSLFLFHPTSFDVTVPLMISRIFSFFKLYKEAFFLGRDFRHFDRHLVDPLSALGAVF
jgi:hypothetical protein